MAVVDHKTDIMRKMKNAGISADECADLLTFLGFDEQDAKRLVARYQPFKPDGFIQWLFESKVEKRQLVAAPSLGVIRLDYDYPPAPGDIDHSGSYMYDVYYRMVPGLTFDMCQSGELTPDVRQNFIDAVKWLEAKDVSGITGDCGFMMWFQKLARDYTSKPVFMSSLAHLPAVVSAMGRHELVAVFTANGKTLEPMRDLIRDECNIDTEDRRLIMVGCEDVPGFEAVAAGAKVDTLKVQPGIVKKARDVIREHPNIRAILMECTELPPYSDALRAATGLPVFDAITCSDFFIRSRLDNPRVGLTDWQDKWDGKQEVYKFGQNIAADELHEVVNKHSLGKSSMDHDRSDTRADPAVNSVEVPEYLKKESAALGVIRLDYDFMPATGDLDHPSTFTFPTYYRVVPGLTWEMCRDGKMSPEVEEAWEAAVKYLDDRDVAGITCDCSLTLWFQAKTRDMTKKPVFLSPVCQLPAIISAFDSGERILIITELKDNFMKLMDLIKDELDLDPTEERFIVVDCWDLPGFHHFLRVEKSAYKSVAEEVVKMVRDTIAAHPNIRGILMESSSCSPFTDHLKCNFGIPVFDALGCCDLFINGSMDNPLFGMNGWQKTWDGKQEKYVLGQNLTKEERQHMNSKDPKHSVGDY